MSEPEPAPETRRWLRSAREDLHMVYDSIAAECERRGVAVE